MSDLLERLRAEPPDCEDFYHFFCGCHVKLIEERLEAADEIERLQRAVGEEGGESIVLSWTHYSQMQAVLDAAREYVTADHAMDASEGDEVPPDNLHAAQVAFDKLESSICAYDGEVKP
jgi:hypothetical protein